MTALIEVRNVHRTYQQGDIDVHALRGVTLQVEAGEFSALAGPSGSGKTTLLNMIGCLDRPTQGDVSIAGDVISAMTGSDAANYRLANIGFVFQAYNLIPVLTARENAEFILQLRGVPPAERKAIVMPLLERVGLGAMAERRPHELSGGQQQRVAVVRALAAKPRLVLADEPTANLDAETSEALLDLMLELNQELGVTFVFSTHDQQVISRCRRVISLRSGQVVA
ncbi:MAG: ABC transporter ATP-binding protein [Myxococcales bacterium]|nr:ABC transporter ATP-binding protein [Myxococcales bacterium]